MKDVSPQARRYLDALRTADAPAADATARVWDGVVARAAAGDLGPELGPDPAPELASELASAGGATSMKSIVLGVLVGAGVAIGGAAAILGNTSDDGTAPRSATTEIVAASADAPAPIVAPPSSEVAPIAVDDAPIEIEDDAAPVADTTPTDASRTEPRPRTKVTKPRAETSAPEPSAPSVDPIAEEVALLADARSALGAGEASRAIAVLARHRKRFPDGMLARERDVSWITALCVLGRDDEARTRANAFLRAHGSSPHAAKVRASCGGKDE